MIQIYCHRDTGILSIGISPTPSPILKLSQKFLTTLGREIIFHDGADPVELPGDAAGIFIGKKKDTDTGLPTGAMLVWDTAWDAPTEGGRGYQFNVPLYGSVLTDAAVTPDADGNLILSGEITVTFGGKTLKSNTFDIVIQPAVYTSEDPPSDPDAPFPLPVNILVKGAQTLTVEEQTQVMANLGIARICNGLAYAPNAAGTSSPAKATAQQKISFYNVDLQAGTGGAFVYNLNLMSTLAVQWDAAFISVSFPASTNPTLVIKDNDSSAVIYDQVGDGTVFKDFVLAVFIGGAWVPFFKS